MADDKDAVARRMLTRRSDLTPAEPNLETCDLRLTSQSRTRKAAESLGYLSLGVDARLRGTITSTFRALAADRPMSEAELAIALQALFRPMESKDHVEIAPPNLVDLLKLDK